MVSIRQSWQNVIQLPEHVRGLIIEHLRPKGANNLMSVCLQGGGW